MTDGTLLRFGPQAGSVARLVRVLGRELHIGGRSSQLHPPAVPVLQTSASHRRTAHVACRTRVRPAMPLRMTVLYPVSSARWPAALPSRVGKSSAPSSAGLRQGQSHVGRYPAVVFRC